MTNYPSDPHCVAPVFCEGICQIEKIGPNFRVTKYESRALPGDVPERIVVGREVWSRDDLALAVRQLQAALDDRPLMVDQGGERPALLS